MAQVKGRFFRTKTLVVEEPVFMHDAEQGFGAVLSRWQEAGECVLAPAALSLKVAEERLLRSAGRRAAAAAVQAVCHERLPWHAPRCLPWHAPRCLASWQSSPRSALTAARPVRMQGRRRTRRT